MILDEKKAYLVKLLMWIWLVDEKIASIAWEIDKKPQEEIDEIIKQLEAYYQNQDLLDKQFLQNIEKINNNIDESIESTIEKFNVEKIIL